ncbi:MAG: hypothetical protein EXR71_03040 [Myxococcales bacterium]|nr:hypothetical protein [Myxococcales bacterium]
MACLIRTDEELRVHLPGLERCARISVDTEFHPEKAYFPKLMLLQLRPDEGEVLLVDPLGPLDLTVLGPALSTRPLLVHGGAADVILLRRHCGATPMRVIDTQILAAFAGLGWPRRLQDLLAAVLGRELDKQETLSDWSRRPLSGPQLQYAADDVILLDALVRGLEARAGELGNAFYVEEALRESLEVALAAPDDAGAWRRIPGCHLLSERERAALFELAAWRESKARGLDCAAAHIVSDSMLFDLARRRPETLDGFRENRRMPSQVWRQHGHELLGILAQAQTTAPPRPPRRGADADAIRLAARISGEASGVAAEYVLRDGEIDYVLQQSDPGGWRLASLGTAFQDFLRGSKGITRGGRLV